MELRHLRYFIAVAEEGNVAAAAQKRLHTAQPSLSRQLRDLEIEVGASLFTRGARGVDLTDAGHAFLAHARLSVTEAAAAVQAARRAARPAKPSPDLAQALQNGEVDLGFLRVEPKPDVIYDVIAKEPIVVILPSDHPPAAEKETNPKSLERETLIGFSDFAIVLREVVESYLRDNGVRFSPTYRVENFATVLSLVASLRGVALMPGYVETLLPWSVVSRPLKGPPLTIDLAVGYRSDNPSPVLETFVAGLEQIKAMGRTDLR